MPTYTPRMRMGGLERTTIFSCDDCGGLVIANEEEGTLDTHERWHIDIEDMNWEINTKVRDP